MEDLVFNFDFKHTTVSFDNKSDKYKELIDVAIKQLSDIQKLKGHIYNSTMSEANKENFQDDMRILMSCEVAIRVLELSKKD